MNSMNVITQFMYNSSHGRSLTRDFSGERYESIWQRLFQIHLWLWIKIIFPFSTVVCDACKIVIECCGISTCMLNSRHEFSLFCSCVDRLYRSKFGAKDRPAGVNNLYVYDSSYPFFTWILMSHFRRSAFSEG